MLYTGLELCNYSDLQEIAALKMKMLMIAGVAVT